jgi:hypothetical protein
LKAGIKVQSRRPTLSGCGTRLSDGGTGFRTCKGIYQTDLTDATSPERENRFLQAHFPVINPDNFLEPRSGIVSVLQLRPDKSGPRLTSEME